MSGGVWERPGGLSAAEWEQVRLHAYYTERILARSEVLEPLAKAAGMHHERQDGSGYHHGASGATVPIEARLLAAADVYQAMTQPRPHRPAPGGDRAAHEVTTIAKRGLLDPECAAAVVESADRGSRVRASWPAGLSDREIEVVRLVAAGLSNHEIADKLIIGVGTVKSHVHSILGKLDARDRTQAVIKAQELKLV